MAEASTGPDRTATEIRSVIFKAVRSVGQRELSERMGLSESTLSDWLAKNPDRLCQMLAVLKLKVVPA